MDIRMPGGTGIDACEQIVEQAPECKVIMLTSYAEDEMLFSAIRAGAVGYVLKQIGGDELIRAIETIGRGESLLDPALTSRVFAEVRRAAVAAEAAAFSELTPQELNVLSGIARGKTNRAIAEVLHLSPGTVRNYVSNILSKLDVANRAEAAAYAVENRLPAYLEKAQERF